MADVIVNASPLIVLARARRLELLRLAGSPVLVPAAVAQEVRAHADQAADALDASPWISVIPDVAVPDAIRLWDLGSGESSVLSCARVRPGSTAIWTTRLHAGSPRSWA